MGTSKSSSGSPPPASDPAPALSNDSAIIKQIAAIIVPKVSSTVEDTIRRIAQREFWTTMREKLSVNVSSSGLFVLDQIAEAILDDTEEKDTAFTDPIMLLPKP